MANNYRQNHATFVVLRGTVPRLHYRTGSRLRILSPGEFLVQTEIDTVPFVSQPDHPYMGI